MSNVTPRRTRVEAGVFKRPDGRLEIGWRDAQGKQRWRSVEGGIRAARAALATEHAKRARGERTANDPRLTFNAAADAWWDARVVKLRPGTQNAYGAALKHLRDYFGKQRMTHITPTDVAKYVSLKQAEPRQVRAKRRQPEMQPKITTGFKGWTIKGHLTVLSSVFTYATRHLGLNAQNPVALLDCVERPSSEDEKPKRIMNADELTKLLNAVDDQHRLLFETAAETGCRIAEVLGLAWDDISFDSQTLAVTHQLDRKGKRDPILKSKPSRRVLEVTPALIGKLREHKLAAAGSLPHMLVFTTRVGSGHDHRNIGGRVLARAVKKAGLETVHDATGVVVTRAPTFHDLRHTHASALIANGWDPVEVCARLGHASVATTLRIYAHQWDAARRSSDRRSRLAKLYGPAAVEAPVEATDGSGRQQADSTGEAKVVRLQANDDEGQQTAAG
jgi:integrase